MRKINRAELKRVVDRACRRVGVDLTREERAAVDYVVNHTILITANVSTSYHSGAPVGCLLTQARQRHWIYGSQLGFAFDDEMEHAGHTPDQGRSYVFAVYDPTWTAPDAG